MVDGILHFIAMLRDIAIGPKLNTILQRIRLDKSMCSAVYSAGRVLHRRTSQYTL